MSEINNELVLFFKALADANRLKIVGLLAQRPYSGEELAALLGLKASTVSHHLSRLSQVGLVSARAEGYYNVYRLEESALQKTRLLFSHTNLVSVADGVDVDGYDRKVIADFTRPDGSLKEIPAQRKKLDAVLRYVVRDFKPGNRYTEKQVNKILSRFHDDTASLRRELVGAKLMEREGGGGEYWRLEGQK
ncbi:MAG: metalloregulator ArsR/SmtB family transcription factor [Anaerolineales bacterium]|jgi:biotin operon repressor